MGPFSFTKIFAPEHRNPAYVTVYDPKETTDEPERLARCNARLAQIGVPPYAQASVVVRGDVTTVFCAANRGQEYEVAFTGGATYELASVLNVRLGARGLQRRSTWTNHAPGGRGSLTAGCAYRDAIATLHKAGVIPKGKADMLLRGMSSAIAAADAEPCRDPNCSDHRITHGDHGCTNSPCSCAVTYGDRAWDRPFDFVHHVSRSSDS